ncbi:MAG: hypothetical protein EBW98_02535 [Actinobacteria bacterium]|nr:hypothetical protein [Actinomycetota bacterium]
MQGAGHRVAITGYGVVAPCGVGKQVFWQGLLGPGIRGAKTVELADWDPQPYFANPKEARRADRVEQFAGVDLECDSDLRHLGPSSLAQMVPTTRAKWSDLLATKARSFSRSVAVSSRQCVGQ